MPPEWRQHTAGVVTIELVASFVHESYSHHVRWAKTMEMRLDCFLCERSGRTTWLELGAEAGTCSGSRQESSRTRPRQEWCLSTRPGATTAE